MINSILGITDVGFYRVMFFYGTLVIIPLRPLSKISAVVVAQSWKDNKKEEVLSVYRKSTIDQLLVGLLVFVGIWGNIDNVLHMIPDEYGGGKFVVFFIGLSNVFVMAAGVSGAIISTSPRYKVLTIFKVIFGLLVVATNLIFIKLFGIVGAAVASAISVLAYSLMRVIFLMKRYKMQPFSLRHLVILFIGVGVYLLSMLIPDLYNENSKYLTLALDIIVRSGMITIVYLGLVYIFKLSPDLESFVGKLVKRIRS
jgi:O-antigen/teichoic acid export membrane protein